MAGYKFNKPWAAESQNVKTFNEDEWETGIVEKSLVSSSQVNGVMQEVTSRFLELEAVEDRQYRYDFIVEDRASWDNFASGNTGTAQSVLIRKGQVQTATNEVVLTKVGVVKLEEGAEIRFNAGLRRKPLSPAIISGGVVRGALTNCRVIGATITNTTNTTYTDTIFENVYAYTESASVALTGGHYCRSVLNMQGNLIDSKLTDCKINNVSELDNCTLVRCEIPNNTKLTDCTLIDCDYAVDTYKDNLVTDTTFRNCNLSFTTTGTSTGAVCNYTNKAYGSKITFTLSKSEHVSMLVYDSQIVFYRSGNTCLFTDSQFFGKSYMDVFGAADTDLINALSVMKDSNGSIITDIPFFRDGSNFRMYISSDTIYPGVINVINNRNSRNLLNFAKQKYFLRYGGGVSTSSITYGVFEFLPWCDFKRYQNTDDSYNIEFILKS